MKQLITFCLLWAPILLAAQLNCQWIENLTGAYAGVDYIRDVEVSAQGQAYVCGSIDRGSPFGTNIILAKYDAGGSPVWSYEMPGGQDDVAFDLALGPQGELYLTGYHKHWIDLDLDNSNNQNLTGASGRAFTFVAAYQDQGSSLAFKWANSYPARIFSTGESVATDGAGRVYVTGHFRQEFTLGGTPYPSAGDLDLFVLALDDQGSTGTLAWGFTVGGPGKEQGTGIATDQAGDIYLTGTYGQDCQFDPLTGSPAGQLPNSSPSSAAFLIQYAPGGQLQWARTLDQPGSVLSNGAAVTVGDDWHIYFTGGFQGTIGFPPSTGTLTNNNLTLFVASYDSQGNHRWGTEYGVFGTEVAKGITYRPGGQVGLILQNKDNQPELAFFETGAGGLQDQYVLNLNQYPTGLQFDWDIAFHPKGCMYLAGSYLTNTPDFNLPGFPPNAACQPPANTSMDGFLARYCPLDCTTCTDCTPQVELTYVKDGVHYRETVTCEDCPVVISLPYEAGLSSLYATYAIACQPAASCQNGTYAYTLNDATDPQNITTLSSGNSGAVFLPATGPATYQLELNGQLCSSGADCTAVIRLE